MNFSPHSRVHNAEITPNYVRFGSHIGKQKPLNVWADVVVRLLLVLVGFSRLCFCASCGLCAVYGSPDVMLCVAALSSRPR